MIPVLYSGIDMSSVFAKDRIGAIKNCSECKVTEERNGDYSLKLTTDVNDETADKISSQKVILAKPNPTDSNQLFTIYKTERQTDGIITAYAKHVKDLCFQNCIKSLPGIGSGRIDCDGTPKQVWDYLKGNWFVWDMNFNFTSDITDIKTVYTQEASTVGDILGGLEGSFLDVWQGEYHWDNYNISYLKERGKKTNYTLQYGKNISNAEQTESSENLYTHIYAYATVKGSLDGSDVHVAEGPMEINGSKCAYKKVITIDCTEELKEYTINEETLEGMKEVRAAMDAYAQQYALINHLGDIDVNISVDYRAELDEMQNLNLCDTITVNLDKFGTTARAKIVSVEYDTLLERWTKLQIGTPTILLSDMFYKRR